MRSLRSQRRRLARSSFVPVTGAALASLLGLLAAASPARAATATLRHQEDRHGDVAVFGAPLGWDCGNGLTPPAGSTVVCSGQTNIADGAPDLFWRDDFADSTIVATKARTSATLKLPTGAKITYARLYWAALKDGATADGNAVLDWLGGPATTITADKTWVVPYGAAHPTWNYYQSSGDATSFVSAWGAGDFRVTDVEAIPLANQDVDRAFAAWTLVVFYEVPSDPLRNLALFDGFFAIDPAIAGQKSVTASMSGFLAPSGFSAKMSAFMYEGDFAYTGDHFTINGTNATDALNPADNFFNSSRSYLGTPVSGTFDVPKLSGLPNSMGGYDLDTVDLTATLKAGDTTATVGADSTLDVFFMGGFATSITSKSPDFAPTKTAVDVNGGALLPNDEVEYTIAATNGGNDTATGVVLTDVLDAGLAFVPGSISVVAGANAGAKTDAAGDDQGEYDAAARTVRVRLGTGANGTTGGTIAPAGTFTVRFRAKVIATKGSISNVGTLEAAGAAGATKKTWTTDGDPSAIGNQPTVVTVDECQTAADCKDPTKPVCDATKHTCGPCKADADCKDPASPACRADGSCGECSATNTSKCPAASPLCDVNRGKCAPCTLGAMGDATRCTTSTDGPACVADMGGALHCGCLSDADCGTVKSGRVCDGDAQKCVDGCRGLGGNGCGDPLACTSVDTSIGKCVTAAPDAGADADSAGDAGDAGVSGDANADDTGAGSGGDVASKADGGCGCAVPGSSGSEKASLAALALGALAAGVVARRRRRAG
jgi:uncharacterized repeat protein (TIGR01451 family)/MYXO-CTERM domain-containing protein